MIAAETIGEAADAKQLAGETWDSADAIILLLECEIHKFKMKAAEED